MNHIWTHLNFTALMPSDLFFCLFASVLLISAIAVISVRNPVHAVLWLIVSFFNGAGLFLLLKAEFLAMLLMIVYVGAVAVLFLFVVMMLDIKHIRQPFRPIFMVIGCILAAELVVMMSITHRSENKLFVDCIHQDHYEEGSSLEVIPLNPDDHHHYMEDLKNTMHTAALPTSQFISNVHAIGRVLYTEYLLPFQISGILLLVAMIGAILLTIRRRHAKRQNAGEQLMRDKNQSIRLVNVPSGKGIKI